ncbi:formate dehydrogenase accessory sulfurtransferase FdhD [Dongia sp. agr-C8]
MTAAQSLKRGPLETSATASPSPCGESEAAKLQKPIAEAGYQLLRRDGTSEAHDEPVAEEVPVAMVYNGLSHVVMMASPTDLEDFALGFSLTEGIIESKSEFGGCEIARAGEGIEARIEISSRAFFRLKEHRRALQGRTGCGLCGVESLDQALRDLPKLSSELRVNPQAVHRALDALPALQGLNRITHALHAAAFCAPDGRIVGVREDVGRHNAFDKLIGALAKDGVDCGQGFAIITSRCSFEMAQKAISAGIPVLAAVSAPTHLAIRLARRYDLTLLALARADSMKLFAGTRRIQP